jgi:hypothetical protein
MTPVKDVAAMVVTTVVDDAKDDDDDDDDEVEVVVSSIFLFVYRNAVTLGRTNVDDDSVCCRL